MLYDRKWEEKPIVVTEPWRRILLDAADLLERNNWCRYVTESDYGIDGRSYCVVGAILNLENGDGREEAVRRLSDALVTRLKLNCARPGYGALTRWNDRTAKSKQEVIAKLREVALTP